jgi:hypothetical protein
MMPDFQRTQHRGCSEGMSEKMQRESGKVSLNKGRYLYAVVAGDQPRNYGCVGINGGDVYTISHRDMGVVVSDVPNGKIRPERRHFAAHQGVLRKLMEDGDLLPMSFGIISKGPKEVQRILAKNRKSISSQLQRVSGKVEMGLKVTWDVPNIFEYILNEHLPLKEARDRFLDSGREPQHSEKIEIGRMFEEFLQADRERHFRDVEDVLAPRCHEIVQNKCREEREVMKLACLVGRESLCEFETAVFEAASLFNDNFAFDYNGPWAPHNFVDIDIEL